MSRADNDLVDIIYVKFVDADTGNYLKNNLLTGVCTCYCSAKSI